MNRRDSEERPDPDAKGGACARSPCPWCGERAPRIDVHGHVQCAACGTNVDPCCGGETAQGD